jgi:hypothetical protein
VQANDLDERTCGQGAESTARRGLLRSLPAAALAGAIALFSRDAEARKRKKPPLCVRCPKLCETVHVVLCQPRTDTVRCACVWTTTGKAVCANTITIFDSGKCKSTNECTHDADCGSGNVCVLVDEKNCCPAGKAGNLCFPVCTP